PVNETAGSIVSESGITDPISTFSICLRRVLTENVIASDSNDCASQQMVQNATTVVAGLSHGLFQRRAILAANEVFRALGIAGHRLFLDWNQGSEVIGKQTVDGPGLVNPVLVKVWRKFVESVDEAHDGNEVEALPCPLEAGITFPFVPTLIRSAWVCGSARQVARPWSELRKDEL